MQLNHRCFLTVQGTLKIRKDNYEQNRNIKQFCPFCLKPIAELPRHKKTVQKAEPEMEEVIHLPLRSAARKQLLNKLQSIGNYKHNTQVLLSK